MTKPVFYKLSMLICLLAECTATYSLSQYQKLQHTIEAASPGAQLHIDSIVNAEITTIIFCVLVAIPFRANFFFLLFFLRHTYPKWYNTTRHAATVVITAGVFAAVVISTWAVAWE